VSHHLLAQAAAAAAAAAAVLGVRAFVAGSPRPAVRVRVPGIAARPWGRRLAVRLERAGVPLGPDAFVAVSAGAVLAGVPASWALTRSPILTALVPIAVVAAARAVLASADRRHLARVAAQLPDVARQLAGAVAAGLSLRQAIGRAAAESPRPVAGELERVAAELALGARLEEALDGLARRLPDPDVGILVTAILVQRRTGGNIARALGDLARRLDERTRLARELRGATAQARATAWMVAALPALGGLALELAAPGVLVRTLGRGPGLLLLVVAAGLEFAAVLLVRRIARVDA
jgi:tight adherence protein B